MMDIHIFGMFSNLSQPNRRARLDEILHSVQLEHLPMWLPQRNVADSDHFDVGSREWYEISEYGDMKQRFV